MSEAEWHAIEYDACTESTEGSCYQLLKDELSYTALSDLYDESELIECTSCTEPADAKKIVAIFSEFIQPKCMELTN